MMPSEIDLQAALLKAEEREREYEWLEAVTSYEKLLSSEGRMSFSVPQIWEKLAFCYNGASRQVKDREQFKRLRQLAVEAYKNAAKLYGKEDTLEAKGKSAQCSALAEYASSWLAPNPSEKRRTLKRCCDFGNESLDAYEKARDELGYGKMCNDIMVCLLDRLYVARNYAEMLRIAQEGIKCASKAVAVSSRTGNKNEMLRAFYTASLQGWYVSNFIEQDEKTQKELVQRSLNYAEKAVKLSKEVNDPSSYAMANWAAAYCTLIFTEKAESALEYAKEMLTQGNLAKDNYLIGVAFYVLAFVVDMITLKEADSDKQKEGHTKIIQYSEEAIKYLNLVLQDAYIAGVYLYYAESCSFLAGFMEAGSEQKRRMLEKAVKIGRIGLKHATASGSQEATFSTLHALSKALHSLSAIAADTKEKTRLLKEALEKRADFLKGVEKAFPSNHWLRGVGKNYEGLIKVELARAETDRVNKTALLESAVLDMEDSLAHCKKWITSRPTPSYIAAVAGFEDGYGGILNELHSFTQDRKTLTKAIEVYEDAAEQFKKADLPSRAAESCWKAARNQDYLGEREKAQENFGNAQTQYKASAKKIPHFSAFYFDYALYMEAWSYIEKARFAHECEEYTEAMKHYEKVAGLLEASKLWGYLSINFLAWSLLEKAEDLSRKEQNVKSMEAFKQAAELFEKTKRTLGEEIDKIKNPDENQKATELCEASVVRKDYCLARANVEEARKYDREGNHVESAEKYGLAASKFERMSEKTEAEDYRKEIEPIAYMCRAWEKMKIADRRVLPELYHEASELFLRAKEHGTKDKAVLLASGNGAFCTALEFGTRFEESHKAEDFAKAKQYLGSAASYYLKAGFYNASAWTSAAEASLDAYNYMTGAEVESNPNKRLGAYLLAEKCLERSAELYETAGYTGKMEEVLKTLQKVKEKRQFASSLRELLTKPDDASSTSAITAPVSTVEEPVGLQKFEREFIHANLVVHQKGVVAGEDLDLEIQLANLGKNAALLTKMEHAIPSGFDLVEEPKPFRVENSVLDMKGKRLNPLETCEFKIVLRSFNSGAFEIKPRIVYFDEARHEASCEPEPVTVTVSKATLPGHVATGCEDLDDMLLGGIPESFAVVLSSPSFEEKDLLIRKFIEKGARWGEVTFYVTIDAGNVRALAEKFQSNFYVFLCNPQVDETLRNLPNVFKVGGVENLTEISIALTSAFRRANATSHVSRRVCIEIISDLLLQHHAVSVRRWLAALLPEFRSEHFTTLAVINPQMHLPQELQAILDLFDGEISIYERETKMGSEKLLKIRKMQDQRYSEHELVLKKERLRD